jgi:multidrug efflux pump
LPLVIAVGAGAEMRRTLGTAVFAGMTGVTAFGIFLTPVFYCVIEWFSSRGKPAGTAVVGATADPASAGGGPVRSPVP